MNDPAAVSPLVVSSDSSTVFVTNHAVNQTGQTVAYNVATGAARWTEPSGGDAVALSATVSTLYVSGVPNGRSAYGGTEAFNVGTGATLWLARQSVAHGQITAAKLSPDGSVLFAAGSSGNVNSVGVTPDGSSVIVSEGINAGPPSNGVSWVTLALNPATGATRWKKAMNPDGSIAYITGWTDSPPEGSGDTYLTIGFSTTTEAKVWTASFGGFPRNYAYAMAVSPSGSQVFVTGTGNKGGNDDSINTVAYPTS